MHTKIVKNRQGPMDDSSQRMRGTRTPKLTAIPIRKSPKTPHGKKETQQQTETEEMQTKGQTAGQRPTDDANQSQVETLNKGRTIIPNKGVGDRQDAADAADQAR